MIFGKEFNKILLIDGLNLFLRNFCVVPTVNKDGVFTGGLFGSLNSIRFLANNFSPDAIVICFDGPGGSLRRRNINPNYKAGRRIPQKICSAFKFETVEEERKSLSYQIEKFRQCLDVLPVFVVTVDNIEADDSISYITTKLCKDKKVIICSADRDFLQLVDTDKVIVYRPTNKEMITEEVLRNQYENINPKNFTILRAIVGDKSDELEGVKGFGDKTVIKLFKEVLCDKESRDIDYVMFYAQRQELDDKKNANKYRIIIDNFEKIKQNYSLMQLYNTNISLSSMETIDRQLDVLGPLLQPFRLRFLFLKEKLYFQVKNIDSFIYSFSHLNNCMMKHNTFVGEKIIC